MNIFDTIDTVTSKIEPIHSRFLADSLRYSAEGTGDCRSLFDCFWDLTAPSDWEVPQSPEIKAEMPVDESRSGVIDIYVGSDDQHNRSLGIEVKTDEGSIDLGQLERYRECLAKSHPESDLAMVYLTPFNVERATDLSDEVKARSLPSVREFERFSQETDSSRAKHISWLDVAEITWDGNELWKQHQEYVKECISAVTILETDRNRTLVRFFGEEVVEEFMQAIRGLGINVGELGQDIEIDLNDFTANRSFGEKLAKALTLLIKSDDRILRHRNAKGDAFDGRDKFLKSEFREVHTAIFQLADSYDYVWVQGKDNYGVRVLHESTSSGVALITSSGTDGFHIRGRR